MSTVTLRPDPQLFPAGTNVKVYPEPLRTPSSRLVGKPPGALVQEVAVGNDGSLQVINLTPGESYVGWAVVGGVDSYVRFACPALAPGVDGEKERAVAAEAGKANAPITAAQILDGAVGTKAVADGAITRAKMATAAIGSAQLGESAVQAGNIETFAVGKNAIDGEAVSGDKLAPGAVGDGVIAAARALLATGSAYGARTAFVSNTEYEPSSTRPTLVTVEAFAPVGKRLEVQVTVGGVFLGTQAIPLVAGENSYTQWPFLVMPGEKWKAVLAIAGMEGHRTYRPL